MLLLRQREEIDRRRFPSLLAVPNSCERAFFQNEVVAGNPD